MTQHNPYKGYDLCRCGHMRGHHAAGKERCAHNYSKPEVACGCYSFQLDNLKYLEELSK